MTDPHPHHSSSFLVFADDWGRHPSSCQHLIRHLLPKDRVTWINTIGTRRPAWNLSTFRRGLEKLLSWMNSGASSSDIPLPQGLRVENPKMWPWFARRHDRSINKKLLLAALRPLINDMHKPVTAITTVPLISDLVGELPVDHWVYYCVDDFGSWPGLDQQTLSEMEHELVAKVDSIITAGDNLHDRILRLGKESTVITHGVDLAHWRGNGVSDDLPELARYEKPLIVFWGVVDKRMDTNFLKQLANDLTAGTILLVGPQDQPEETLFSLPRVAYLPPWSYEQLPQLAKQATVLIMPYKDEAVTRAMQPLKLKEYLATGKPAVVRDLPAVDPWRDLLQTAATAEEFSQAVRNCLGDSDKTPQAEVLHQRLASESWEEKAVQFRKAVLERF